MSLETSPKQEADFRGEENKIFEGSENKNAVALYELVTRRLLESAGRA